MISQIETWILGSLQTLYDAWGWAGVTLLMVFENATGITPSEIILGLAGWMLIEQHGLHPALIFGGGLVAAIGSVTGSSITYWTARLGGRPLIDKLARWVRITPAHISRVETQFHRWGSWLVFFGRVMPGVRTLVSIPAGLARMPFGVFSIATFFGAYIWCTLLLGAGYALGQEWPLISAYVKQALPYLLALGAVGLVVYFWFKRCAWFPKLSGCQACDE